ncbi:MAG: hydrogenase iron-sulfur subunit [Candidatus Helarchaeota archaeon]
MTEEKLLVIGGGVAGIQAALDLANMGEMVVLVEVNPSIGGRMAQLDKTFPTNDCSICILAPKMVECARHPNITLLTYSELEQVERKERGFRVKIRRKQRFVDETKCTGCGICAENCPIEVPNEFDMGLRMRKAVYIPFPQAVPNVATVDREACVECRVCEKLCQAKAINLDAPQTGELVELDVYAILLATGFELFDPSSISQLGYGHYANVITALEFERLMCASGPTGGHILRLVDGKKPQAIALIQCVGSRSTKYKPYCSRVCCMYATKEAIITKEHDPAIDITIFYNDLRAYGKGFFEYTERAKEEYHINYVNAIPHMIEEDPVTKDLFLSFENRMTHQMEEKRFDLAVLCPAIIPNRTTADLAKKLGINLNENGFYESYSPLSPIQTNIPGIYIIGACSGPKDIPESVAEASGGAFKVIRDKGISLYSKKRENEPLESMESESPPRIGVFVCHCGTNIGGIVNVPEVVEYVKTLPNVVYARDTLYTCSEDSQVLIKEAIKENNLNRVVVASCTPRTHEPLFRATCSEAGLNQYLFEMANIREQVSWVHSNTPELATEKAKDVIRMAIERAKYLEPQEPIQTEVTPAALVIGGGVAGMTAALDIAEKGFPVYLIEKKDKLGGLINELHHLSQDKVKSSEFITSLINQIYQKSKINVLTNSKIKEVTGSIGNFNVKLETHSSTLDLNVGVIIVATGARELKPYGVYNYGIHPKVKTLLEYEQLLWTHQLTGQERVAFILCVGAREKEGVPYCSAICCSNTLHNAILTKELHPHSEIVILYRDICVTGDDENLYRKAREKGIQFIKYSVQNKPILAIEDLHTQITVNNVYNDEKVSLEADWLVLTTPLIPMEENENISKLLKVPLTQNGFFLEAHLKHRPLDFATDGIFLCGTCHSPKTIPETISQANGAATRALIPLLNRVIESDALIAHVNQDLCVGCEICELNCPYGAAKLVEIEENVFKSSINPALCKGCGVCAAGCPVNAITLRNYEDKQLNAMIKIGLENKDPTEPRIIVFLCNWCSYAGADNAGVSRFQYPSNIRPIRVMCSGRVSIHHIFNALLYGADGVLVTGCHPGDCHYISGNFKTERRVKFARELLKLAGLNPDRVRLEWISASEGNRFAKIITEYTQQLKALQNNQEGRVNLNW